MQKISVWCVWMVVAALLLLSGCSTTKYVPEGELLLHRVRVVADVTDPKVNTTPLKDYIRQNPNSRWFSVAKLPLATYSLSGRDTTSWLNRTLRSMGEAPVLYDSLLALQTCADLRQELQNEGYLHADVGLQTRRRGKKKMDVIYQLHPGEAFFLRHVNYEIMDPNIAQLLEAIGDSTQRLIHEGQKFDVNRLDDERKRLTQELNN